MQAKSII
jgi:hypothetical protein